LSDDVEDQVDAYLRTHSPAGNELIIVEGGANDLLSGGVTDVSVPARNLAGFIADLYNDGGRKFLVPNLPPLGKIPGEVGGADEAVLDMRSRDFNADLSARLDVLETTLSDITIYRVDFYGAVQAVLDMPSAFGFANVVDPAFNSDTNQVVPDPNQYLFWDNIHPTAPSHRMLGNLAANQILGPIVCDFDFDSLCGLADMNLMLAQGNLVLGVATTTVTEKFDLADNNFIDAADITEWLSQAAAENGFDSPYLRGDTDGLDPHMPTRTIDVSDFQNFRVGFTGTAVTWEVGNFDGDNDVDITDFSKHFLPSFQATSGGTYGPSQSTPEPSTVLLLGLGGLWMYCLGWGRQQVVGSIHPRHLLCDGTEIRNRLSTTSFH